jgi:hypothetical protein
VITVSSLERGFVTHRHASCQAGVVHAFVGHDCEAATARPSYWLRHRWRDCSHGQLLFVTNAVVDGPGQHILIAIGYE